MYNSQLTTYSINNKIHPIMKTITEFKLKKPYEKKMDYAKVVYFTASKKYAMQYKYTSMENEETYIYDEKDHAMYDYMKKVMFLLS